MTPSPLARASFYSAHAARESPQPWRIEIEMARSLQSAPPPPHMLSTFDWYSDLSTMACLFPQAWGWRSEKSGRQDTVEDDELLPQGGPIAPLPSLLSFSLNLDSVANRPSSSSTDVFSDDLLYVPSAAIYVRPLCNILTCFACT